MRMMRLTKEELSTRVVVRRAGIGAAPFRWEVYRAEAPVPVFVSPSRFSNMDAAYRDGQARLPEFMPPKRAPRYGLDEWIGRSDALAV